MSFSLYTYNICGKCECLDPVNLLNHTSWAALLTQTDRPKSLHICWVIEVFGGVLGLSICFFDFSIGIGAIIIELSQINSFFHLVLIDLY